MKKRICICCLGILFVLSIFVFLIQNKKSENIILKSQNEQNVVSSNAISMMYETEVGSGEYQSSTDTTWPSSGYIFNERLSKCENGGTLSWNEETKRVIMQTNTSDKCYVYFDKYEVPTISNVTASNITTSSITLNVTANGGTNSIATYYYSKDNGISYESSTSSSYTFSGLNSDTAYNFKVYVLDTAGYSSSTKSISATTDNAVLLANYIKGLYTTQGANGIYYHDSSLANSAADNSYRYAGANPNNYVCFGSDAATCPTDNLYRIIGVFDSEVKLIKSTSYGYDYWGWNSNTWSSSIIRSTLNTTYYNTLSATWQNKIATHTWKVGGMAWSTTNTAKQYYDVEVGSSSSSTTDSMKIGLMYVSDYGFAASPDYWTTNLYNYDSAKSTNWLTGLDEWTVSRDSSDAVLAFYVDSPGCLNYSDVTGSVAARPSFYLTSSTTYVSGSGSSADPFRIN